jgi:hypothetical protein
MFSLQMKESKKTNIDKTSLWQEFKGYFLFDSIEGVNITINFQKLLFLCFRGMKKIVCGEIKM